MKIQAMALLAGFSAPLIFGGSASGGFLGVECCAKPNPFGLLTVNVYAVFDRPGEDFMFGVAGTPTTQLTIEVMGGGSFYQHPFGDDQAPDGGFLGAMPSLAYDTFVTIGVKCTGEQPCQPVDNLILSPTWPGFGPSLLRLTNDGWAVLAVEPQADPFNPLTFTGNGKVLIGQFSTADGTAIQGTMSMLYTTNGATVETTESFFCDGTVGCSGGGCQSDEECSDDDPCNGEELCVGGDCLPSPPDPDCNGNGVLDSCDITNGTSTDANGNGVPDDCDVACQSDFDNDGIVGIVDFLELLGDWGPCR